MILIIYVCGISDRAKDWLNIDMEIH
jgi:hypothetical protein